MDAKKKKYSCRFETYATVEEYKVFKAVQGNPEQGECKICIPKSIITVGSKGCIALE